MAEWTRALAQEEWMAGSGEPGKGHPDRLEDKNDLKVLVGWTHRLTQTGIDLRLQGVRSQIALENDQIESSHILMTNSQAMLLAKYLLDVTGQALPKPPRRKFWRS
jgi:hypothetical protein